MIQFQPPGIRDERDKTGKCLTPVRFRFPCPAASEITFFTFMNAQDELKIRDMEILFQPFHSRKLSTPTRIVLPAMTRGFSPNGVPTDQVAAYYKRRAGHEVGLIITEGTFIDEPSASPSSNYPNFFGGASLRGWKKVLEAVHATDCKIAPQLWHVGMARPFKGDDLPNPELPPIGPSGIDVNTLEQTAEPMSIAKIEEVINAFARAAADAKRLGFDGVELHGAHGYLIDQFFWKETNRRTDEYGGDLTGRTRFASRIIHAVRKAVGSRFPIIFRFSQWKTGHYDAKLAYTPMELEAFLAPLTDAGVDIFDCSTRRFWEPEFEGSRLNLAGWTRKLTGKPTISVGSVGLKGDFTNAFDGGPEAEAASVEPLVERLKAGEFDLIAVGRALLADAEWAEKIRHAREKDIHLFTKEDLKTLK